MAAHVRRQICSAIATTLTGLSTTGANVYLSRVYPLADADLPALLVFANTEASLAETMGEPRTMTRSLQVEVAAVAKANASLDATLDQIAKEVEIALAMPVAALEGIAKTIGLTGTEFELTVSAEKPTGRARLLYQVDYFTQENAPDVAL